MENANPNSQVPMNSPAPVETKRSLDKRDVVIGILAVIILVAGAAGASAYLTRESAATATPPQPTKTVIYKQAPQQQLPKCNDNNVLGMAAGALGGGVAGHAVGKGSGKTAATIGGALAGGYLGKEYIPLQNTTCRD